MAFDSQLLPCVFSSVSRLLLRQRINSSGKFCYLYVKLVDVYETEEIWHVAGHSTSAKHVSRTFMLLCLITRLSFASVTHVKGSDIAQMVYAARYSVLDARHLEGLAYLCLSPVVVWSYIRTHTHQLLTAVTFACNCIKKQCPCFILTGFIIEWMTELLICPRSTCARLSMKSAWYFNDVGGLLCRLLPDYHILPYFTIIVLSS